MKIAIYGGSFNPPHIGHIAAARSAMKSLRPDKLILIPSGTPPHKRLDPHSPDAEERLLMVKLACENVSGVEVSDIELRRGGLSYTADTIEVLQSEYPGAEFYLLMATDMLQTFGAWYRAKWLAEHVRLAVFTRRHGEEKALRKAAAKLNRDMGVRVDFIDHEPEDVSSTMVRERLKDRDGRQYLHDEVYARIIKNRSYGARPEFLWLRSRVREMLDPARVAHVRGCEEEAVKLAFRWEQDTDSAAEAAILHDVTKKLSYDEQLLLCKKYAIITDNIDSAKLMHAITGAELSRELFGVSDEVYDAIRWHTTGRADMTMLEKIIYLADYIEPNRSGFEGLEKLRELAYSDIDAAMVLGLELTLEELREQGIAPHAASVEALEFYKMKSSGERVDKDEALWE